jgi:hypothetical protein
VYGVVPPDGFAVNVTDCPESIVSADGVMAPAVRTELTVTRLVEEETIGAFVDVSVTL